MFDIVNIGNVQKSLPFFFTFSFQAVRSLEPWFSRVPEGLSEFFCGHWLLFLSSLCACCQLIHLGFAEPHQKRFLKEGERGKAKVYQITQELA